jgi:4-amino-4-deoxy-L-arabinose transferase-like glycosyltransferase
MRSLHKQVEKLTIQFQNTKASTKQFFLMVGIATIAIILHSMNLYYYPAWFFDEGAYLTFGLHWLRSGQLTYYGHPFAFLAFLSMLFAIANPISYLIPRIIMVVFSAFDTILVYFISIRLHPRGRVLSSFAALIYAATPLSVRYLRLVVVDNFMTFFLLLTTLLLLMGPRRYFFSALCFGLAVISKQTAIFFLPAVLFLIYRFHPRRILLVVAWIIIATIPTAIWILYGTFEVGFSNLVVQQFALTSLGGERAVNALNLILQRITSRDPFIFIGIVGIVWAVYKRYVLVLFPIFYLAFFVVLFLKISTVYLIPVLPFFSILGALLVFDVMKYFPSLFGRKDFRILSVACLILLLSIVSIGVTISQHPATSQEQALRFVGSLGRVNVVTSYTYLWLLEQNYPRVTAYDRYNVPSWSSLPNGTRLYLIVDYPGDLLTIQAIHPLTLLYENSPKINFTDIAGIYLVQVVNSTLSSI